MSEVPVTDPPAERLPDEPDHPGAHDELAALEHAMAFDDPTVPTAPPRELATGSGAMVVLRRGLADSPELRRGLKLTVAFAIIGAVGRLTIPVLVQQVIDKGLLADEGFRPAFTFGSCGLAAVIVIGVALLSRVTYIRLVTAAEAMLRGLRVRAFAHVHALSMADHDRDATGRADLTGDQRHRDHRPLRPVGRHRLDRRLGGRSWAPWP